MYRDELQDDEDLRVEIFHLKKKLSNISTENHLLKVKIRKLQNEIIKKDKEMDVVLDPRKSIDVRKILYERSASFVLNMKEKNDELLDLLREKDVIIRRLQNQLEVRKLYSQTKKHCKCSDRLDLDNKIHQIQLKLSCHKETNYNNQNPQENKKKKKERSLSWTPGLLEAESTLIEEVELEEEEDNPKNKNHNCYDIKEQYKSLSRDHLLSIIENLKNNQRYSPSSRQTSSRKSSPESDLERIELLCESPHEEIQQLHLHFLDMISEVDHLKNRISQLQNNQEKTENVLKKKNTNIDKLAQEIKNLKRPKSKSKPCRNRSFKCYSSADLVAGVYSTNSSSKNIPECLKNEPVKRVKSSEKSSGQKERKLNKASTNTRKEKQSMKDAITQVEKIDSPENTSHCVYIEKESIKITQKANSEQQKNDKEFDYEDEIFDECDEESVAVN